MKRLWALVALVAVVASVAFAQNQSPLNPAGLTAAGSSCTGSNCLSLVLPANAASVGLTLSGTWSATVQFEVSADGANFISANAAPHPTGALVSSATANGTWVVPVAGMVVVRARVSSYSSGTVIAYLYTSSAPFVIQQTGGSTQIGNIGGLAAAGTAPSGNPVLLGGYDTTNVQTLRTGTNGVAAVGDTFTDQDALANTGYGLQQVGAGNAAAWPLAVFSHLFNGATWDRQFYCPNTSTFSVASTVTQVVALSGSTKIRICSVSLNPSTITAGSVDLVYGTGTNCGTGTTTLTGAFTLPAAAVVNIPVPLSAQGALTTPAAQAVCVRTVTSTVNGFITWAQF